MFDQFSKQVDEFGNSVLNALNQVQSFFGKELDVANPVKNSILEMVGNTPLIRLNHVASHIRGIDFYIKAEFQNPTGSLRDRSALAMIQDGIKRGRLTQSTTILIHGSGTSSFSMAWAGRTLGYKVVCYVKSDTSAEDMGKLSYYGAEVKKIDTDSLEFVKKEAIKPGYWFPDENSNMANPNHHFARTGPEIYRDMKGKVDYFVTGGGTGGTVTGIGRYFRSHKQELDTKIILAGWKESIFDKFFGNKSSSVHLPEIFDPKVVDEFVAVSKDEAIHYQSDLLVREGIPVGITTGMVLCAAIRYAEKISQNDSDKPSDEKKNLVILCPDRD